MLLEKDPGVDDDLHTCERSSLWYGAPYGPGEPQLIGTEVRTVTDDDIGLKVLYKAPCDASDSIPASFVE